MDKIAKRINDKYKRLEGSLAHGIELAIDIGELFISVKETPGIKLTEWIEENGCEIKEVQARKYIRIARHKVQARIAFKEGKARTIDKMQKILPKASEPPLVLEAEPSRLGYVGSQPGKADSKNDWYTPEIYVIAAKNVMGSIDLDPFSSVSANENIQAERFITVAENAFEVSWCEGAPDNVWMNPPYSKGLAQKAVDKFLEEWDRCSFSQAIVLMNSSTDTKWFRQMISKCSAVCFTTGRIAFETQDGKRVSGNTKGQVFFYFGTKVKKFRKEFSDFGIDLNVEDFG